MNLSLLSDLVERLSDYCSKLNYFLESCVRELFLLFFDFQKLFLEIAETALFH